MIALVVFLLSSVCIYFSYTHTQNYLKHNTLEFTTLPVNKQYYVVKNVIKGIYLALLSLIGGILVIPGVFYNEFDNNTIRILASMYVSNDFIGLYKVSNLPTSTRLHHATTLIFLLVSWSIDFQTNNVGQLILLYTYFSALAFPVNLYLGLRLCYPVEWLKHISKYIYLWVCVLNWGIQYYWYIPSSGTYIYFCLLLAIVFDDIVLLKWLWK